MSKGIIINYTIVPTTGRTECACAGLFRNRLHWNRWRRQQERRPGISSVIFEESFPNTGPLHFGEDDEVLGND